MLTHPKIASVGALGFAVHVAGIVYCGQHMTDGFVPRNAVPGLLNFMNVGVVEGSTGDDARALDIIEHGVPGFDSLESTGLWKWDENRHGWVLHDYLDYN